MKKFVTMFLVFAIFILAVVAISADRIVNLPPMPLTVTGVTPDAPSLGIG